MKNKLLWALLISAGILPRVATAATFDYRLPLFGFTVGAPSSSGTTGGGSSATGVGSLSASSLDFGTGTVIGFPSASQSVQFSNTGDSALTLNAVEVDGPYMVAYNCPVVMAPGSRCQIIVTFLPVDTAQASGKVTVRTTAGDPVVLQMNGSGIRSTLFSTPDSLDYGKVAVGSVVPRTLNIYNQGASGAQITELTIVAGANAFAVDYTDCDHATLQASKASQCMVRVNFNPTTIGASAGTLEIKDNQNHVAHVPLKGSSVAAGSVTWQPNSLSFGNLTTGDTSEAKTLVLSNTGTTPVDISGLQSTGPFNLSHSCSSVLGLEETCTVQVRFSPTQAGASTGTIALASPNLVAPANVTLTGTGLAPQLSVTGNTLLADLQVGADTQTTLTVKNTGSLASQITGVALQGDSAFSQTSDCVNATLAAGSGTCAVNVTVHPTKTTLAPTTLTITDAAGHSASAVLVGTFKTATGSSTPSIVEASATPTGLNFGIVSLGSSGTQTFTILPASSDTQIQTVTVDGDSHVAVSQGCAGQTLTAGGPGCVVTSTFTPVVTTALTATKIHVALSNGKTLDLPVTGSAVQPAPNKTAAISTATATPGAITFADTPVGSGPSAPKSFEFQNTSAVPLSFLGALTQPDAFAATHNCPPTLPAGATCTFNITFSPTKVGATPGSVSVFSDASNQPNTVSLAGIGLGESLTISPTAIAFGSQNVLSTPAPQTLTLTNKGNVGATVTGLNLQGDSQYSLADNTCLNATLAAGATCTVSVRYAPTKVANATAVVQVTSLAGAALAVPITGEGKSIGQGSLSTTTLAFNDWLVGTTATTKSVLFANSGAVPLAVKSVATTGPFATTHNCPDTLATGASCTLNVDFVPTVAGVAAGSLTLTTDGATPTSAVTLTGTGTAPKLSASTASLTFEADSLAGKASSVSFFNTGTYASTIKSVVVTGDPQFTSSTSCSGKTLAVGGTDSCTTTVTYTATAYGTPNTGKLTVTDMYGSTAEVALSGVATAAQPTFSVDNVTGTAFNLGAVKSLTAVTKTITVGNTGAQPVAIKSLAGTGLTVTGGTCSVTTSLAKGQTCTVDVSFTPTLVTAEVAETRSLTIGYNNSLTAKVDLTDTPYGGWLEASTANYSFGTKVYGATYQSTGVTITNKGTRAVTMDPSTNPVLASTNSDVTASHDCGTSLAAGASCNVTIRFTPSTRGALAAGAAVSLKSNGLQLPTGGSAGDIKIGVSATVQAAVLTPQLTSLAMSSYVNSPQSTYLQVQNTGDAPMMLTGVSVSGANSSLYTANLNGCTTLQVNGTCQVQVTYTPTALGTNQKATLNIAFSGGPNSPAQVELVGTANQTAQVASFGSYKAWNDGSFATSCNQYMVGDATHIGTGSLASASGVYKLTDGANSYTTYCDMQYDGGGWTLLARRDTGSSVGTVATDFTSANPTSASYLADSKWLAVKAVSTKLRVSTTNAPTTASVGVMTLSKWTGQNYTASGPWCSGIPSSLSNARIFWYDPSCDAAGRDYTILGLPSGVTYISNDGTLKWDSSTYNGYYAPTITIWLK